MKVVLNDGVDFANVELDCIPRQGELIYHLDVQYLIWNVEWCLGEDSHVNLMLEVINET